VLKYLLQKGFIDGSCMTVTGKTMAENLAGCPDLSEGQQVCVGGGYRLSDTMRHTSIALALSRALKVSSLYMRCVGGKGD
jgi:hypothetical protein